ncbi:hypothetical protein SERLA73DRAFT_184141 [Serpula lacrymans var. lacrymans S7.3]|uniref:Uncharacterized protein n=2 Tax=Serpula lacrymans var. lacrymans TaxID=341189 RepID=F8Q2M4_SERL3|nr:uncharacterized protein SERLADRAFT_471666 [Serpula lacrymans var. lacrymans S7.9]EGN97435.1 hypothetical protein SERLA73DRAFT_184141 [Serpula lacrymans var. lacrymans S7.3]EGO23026.1 hypothetical protein SERLADRAFT_471666 [Serpula lacrymans var. lacrymans S7.9]
MQAFLNLIARVAGNSYVGRLIRSAEYAVNHTRNGSGDDDSESDSQSEGNGHENDGDAGGDEGAQVSDGALDRSHDSANSDGRSRSRSNSVSSGYNGKVPSSHDLHAYVSQSPHKFERLPSPESVNEEDGPAAETQFPPSAIPHNYSVNRKRSRDDLEDMYATPGPSTAAHPRASKRLQKQKAVDAPLAPPSGSRKRPLEIDDDNESLAPSESASQRGWKGKGKAVDNGRQNKRLRLEDEEGHDESSSSVLAQSAGWFKWLKSSVSASQRALTPIPDAGDEPSEEVESIGSHAESEPELQYPFSSEELALERLSAASKVPYSDLHDNLSMVPSLPQSSLSLEVQPVGALSLAVPSDVVPYTGPSSASDVVVLSSREARVRSLRPRPEVKADAGKKLLQIDRRRGAPLRRDPWRIREKDGEIELHHVDSDF